MGRTLKLSRSGGQTTELKLKRQGDWAQPLVHKEKQTKAAKNAIAKRRLSNRLKRPRNKELQHD
jgi:prophage tail gpP-like protein